MSSRPEEIRIIRSARRKKSVQARFANGAIEVHVPAGMNPREEKRIVDSVVAKLKKRISTTPRSDDELQQRAEELNKRYYGGKASWSSIRWVSNQSRRWGSCTVATNAIRITDRLADVPDYVLNSVILHELAHTIVPDHSDEFWEYANRAPHLERARGYLEALQRYGPAPMERSEQECEEQEASSAERAAEPATKKPARVDSPAPPPRRRWLKRESAAKKP